MPAAPNQIRFYRSFQCWEGWLGGGGATETLSKPKGAFILQATEKYPVVKKENGLFASPRPDLLQATQRRHALHKIKETAVELFQKCVSVCFGKHRYSKAKQMLKGEELVI